jgi:hypothetical protein
MRFHHLVSSCLIATALVSTPLAAADPVPVVTTTLPTPAAKAADMVETERYAAREKQSPAAATFEGGSNSVYIGGSALTVVLIILLVVIIL